MYPVPSCRLWPSSVSAVSAPLAAQGIPRGARASSQTVNTAPRFMVANPFAFAPADSAPAVKIGTGAAGRDEGHRGAGLSASSSRRR